MDVQLTNKQQLCDVKMSIWTNISEECFQHHPESGPQIIWADLKAKAWLTQPSVLILTRLTCLDLPSHFIANLSIVFERNS